MMKNIFLINGNEDISEKNIKIFIEDNGIKFKKEIKNLKKVYKIMIKINQNIKCKKMLLNVKI
jgi:hypothetical protein